ncbi:unnamed protein product [Effrenium voratum]|uniref:Uncharacterized protein n=1 Tax=Effrenium voratum TaxID=2562239 RepID=A0AA36HL26_9DINO|nr:unnamed protein product [Effrenium voratum]
MGQRSEQTSQRVCVKGLADESNAKDFILSGWDRLRIWWLRSTEAEFLCEDARRHQRHYMFAAFGIVGCYKICTVLASVMTWRMWLFYNGVTVLVLLIAHLSAKKPEALWVDFVYAVISFVLLLHTSRLYETLILQELMPSGSSEVDLLCAFIFHSQIMVSMGHHPAVLVAWGLAVHCSCWMTNNADLQMDIKIVLSVGFLMYASTHQSQIQLRDTRLESEAELSRFRKREARVFLPFLACGSLSYGAEHKQIDLVLRRGAPAIAKAGSSSPEGADGANGDTGLQPSEGAFATRQVRTESSWRRKGHPRLRPGSNSAVVVFA